jgi:hypothetical protein
MFLTAPSATLVDGAVQSPGAPRKRQCSPAPVTIPQTRQQKRRDTCSPPPQAWSTQFFCGAASALAIATFSGSIESAGSVNGQNRSCSTGGICFNRSEPCQWPT